MSLSYTVILFNVQINVNCKVKKVTSQDISPKSNPRHPCRGGVNILGQ
jgi:hypothetical protein